MIAACTMVRNWLRRIDRVSSSLDLHHVDRDELLLGIDPEDRAGIARPAIFADRARQRRIADARADLEAQAEAEARRPARPAPTWSAVMNSSVLLPMMRLPANAPPLASTMVKRR